MVAMRKLLILFAVCIAAVSTMPVIPEDIQLSKHVEESGWPVDKCTKKPIDERELLLSRLTVS